MAKIKSKTFKHNKDQVCQLSNRPIDTERDDYTIVLRCQGDKIKDGKFFKSDDFNDLMSGNAEAIQRRIFAQAQGMAGHMLEKMGILPQQKVYDIK